MNQNITTRDARSGVRKIWRGIASSLILLGNLAILMHAEAAPLPDSIKLSVSVEGAVKTLHLHRRSIRGANFVVRNWDQTNGYTVVVPTPEVRTFRGTVAEDPNSLVLASINSNNVLRAQFFDLSKGKGRLASIVEDVSAQLVAPLAADAMPSQTSASPKNANAAVSLAGPKVPTGISPTGIPYGEIVEVEQAADVTNTSYNNLAGNVDDILARYEFEFLVYDMMMTRDCLIRVVLPQIVLRTQPFYANGATPGLQAMHVEWNGAVLGNTDWDMVWATQGYYARGNQVGKDESPVAAGAIFHETGHNWSVYHLAYAYDTMGGNRPFHGAYSIDKVLFKRAESIDEGDLTLAAPYGDPLHPHTHTDVARVIVNTPKDLDVMANDWDANGDNLSIVNFTTTTVNGGSVTLNPNGTLHYTPATNFVGKDMVVYTVQDDSTMQLKARELLHIEVVNNGLMLHYAFDETTGTIVSDSSGIGLAGDLNGADFSTDAVDSPMGKGIRGWGWENDNDEENATWSGVVVGNGSVLPVATVNNRESSPFDFTHNQHSGFYDVMDGNYTASIFFCVDDYNFSNNYTLSGAPWIFAKWWHTETKCGWGLQATDDALIMHYRPFKGSEDIRTVTGNYDFKAGKWYHTAVVFDRALNEVRLYVNGAEVAKETNAFPADAPYIFTGRMPLRLGTFGAEKMSLDDFRLYSKALTVGEISSLVNAAGTTKFLSNAVKEITHYSPWTFDYGVSQDVWDGEGTGITYTKLSGDEWLSVSTDGQLGGMAPAAGVYNMSVQVSNDAGDSDVRQYQVTVISKGVFYEKFAISSASISGLTDHASFPHLPTTTQVLDHAEIPLNVGDYYGSRMQAYLVPDTTGDYTFWVSGDDVGELWLSTSESPEDAVKIASLPSSVNQYAWDANPLQESATITLEAGKKYYLMALHVEGAGADHFSVAWEGPGITRELIPNSRLEIYYSNIITKWNFDENSGLTAGDGVPYGIDGTLDASVTWVAGKRGSAVSLDSGKITLGRSDFKGDWTWSGWVKRTGTAQGIVLLSSNGGAVVLLYPNTQRVGYTAFGVQDWHTGYTAPLDSWVYLSLVMDGGDFKVYQDGVFQSSVAVSTGNLPLNAINMGAFVQDDVILYNKALPESELFPFSLQEGEFAVHENVAAGTYVASVAGKNIWEVPLNYSITAGNAAGAFAINSSTGVITMVGTITAGEQYVLSVAVNDGSGLTQSGTVTININTFDGVQAWEEAVNQGTPFAHKRTTPLAGNSTVLVDLSSISGDATFEFIVDAEEFGQQFVELLDGSSWSLRLEQWSNTSQLGVTHKGVADYLLTAEAGQSVASPYGTVHHIVYVVDSASAQTRVYVDGVFVGATSQLPILNEVSVTLGSANLRSDTTSGILAFAAYDNVMGAAEILTHSDAWFGTTSNHPPVFTTSSLTRDAALETRLYTGATLAGSATDADVANTLVYSKLTGPAWLTVAPDGSLSGSPTTSDLGSNLFDIQVSDGQGGTDSATLNISVIKYRLTESFGNYYSIYDWSRVTDGDLASFAWTGRGPQVNDHITVEYGKSIGPGLVKIITGHPSNGLDNLANGVMETSNDGLSWTNVTTFSSGTAEATLAAPVRFIRLRCTASQSSWLVVREFLIPSDYDADSLSDSWEMTFYGNVTTVAAGDDTDGDRLTSFQEMVFGADPNVVDAPQSVVQGNIVDDGGTNKLEFKFRRPQNYAELNVVYTMETSNDMNDGNWTASALTPTITQSGSNEWVRYLIPLPSGGATRIFCRVNVTQAP